MSKKGGKTKGEKNQKGMKLYVPVDDCDVATCGSDTSRRDELGCQRRQRRRVFVSLPAELVADAAITTSDDNCLALKVDCLIEGPNDKGSNIRREGVTRYNAFNGRFVRVFHIVEYLQNPW